jgi:hypothetical protein
MAQITFNSKDSTRTKYALLHWLHHNPHPQIEIDNDSHVRLSSPGSYKGAIARVPIELWYELCNRKWIAVRKNRFDTRLYCVTRLGRRAARDKGFEFGRP